MSVAHTRDRVQFGRPLSKFQAVQHALAGMAGEIERARAAAALAVAAAADHGFGSAQTEYAVTVAKVAVGQAVGPVTTIAHQLHGAIGVTIEHPLWSATMRAQSWTNEYGTTAHHARRLGRMALDNGGDAGGLWDVLTGNNRIVRREPLSPQPVLRVRVQILLLDAGRSGVEHLGDARVHVAQTTDVETEPVDQNIEDL